MQILAATIHKPDLLILDEPFSGLDPVSTGDGIRMAMAIGADLWHMDNQAGPDFNFRIPGKDWAFGYSFSPPGNGHVPAPLPVHLVFDKTMRKSGPTLRVECPLLRETVPEAMDLNSNPSRQIPEAESADFAFNRGSVNAFNFIALQPIDMP